MDQAVRRVPGATNLRRVSHQAAWKRSRSHVGCAALGNAKDQDVERVPSIRSFRIAMSPTIVVLHAPRLARNWVIRWPRRRRSMSQRRSVIRPDPLNTMAAVHASALETVRQWTYRPYRLNLNTAVEVETTINASSRAAPLILRPGAATNPSTASMIAARSTSLRMTTGFS